MCKKQCLKVLEGINGDTEKKLPTLSFVPEGPKGVHSRDMAECIKSQLDHSTQQSQNILIVFAHPRIKGFSSERSVLAKHLGDHGALGREEQTPLSPVLMNSTH